MSGKRAFVPDTITLSTRSCFLVFLMWRPVFQAMTILTEKLDIFVVVYLDDILIYTKDFG